MSLSDNQKKPEVAMFTETSKLVASRSMRDADPSMAISVAVIGLATASGIMTAMSSKAHGHGSLSAVLASDLLDDLDAMFVRLKDQMGKEAQEIFSRHRARLAEAGGVEGLRKRSEQ